MTVNRHKYFRWTKRTAFINLMYVVVVPATLGFIGYNVDVSACEVRDLGDHGLMLDRASGICAVRGGETPSLSFREWVMLEMQWLRVYIMRVRKRESELQQLGGTNELSFCFNTVVEKCLDLCACDVL
jgi:hypothetical protein